MGFIVPLMMAVSAASSIKQASDQRKAAKAQEAAQNKATEQAQQQATFAQQQADQEYNKRNQKKPMDMAATTATLGKSQGTLLTGTGGVDPNALVLGRNTLLGQ